MDKEIQIFINRLRRRLGLQKVIDILPVFLSLGFFIAFLHVFFGYFRPFYYAGTIGIFWILASFLCGSIYLLLHFPKEQEAAHTGDRAIGQERLLTALELRGNDGAVPCLQKKDTLAHILTCNIKEAFPYKLPPKQMLACFLTICLFFIFLFLPSGAKSKAEKLHALKQEAKTEAALMEEIKKELEQEIKTAEKDTPSAVPETVGEKLAAYGKSDMVKELLTKAKEEYSSADSRQDLQKAKERLNFKLSQMAQSANSADEQDAISNLMERAGLSPYNQEADHVDSNDNFGSASDSHTSSDDMPGNASDNPTSNDDMPGNDASSNDMPNDTSGSSTSDNNISGNNVSGNSDSDNQSQNSRHEDSGKEDNNTSQNSQAENGSNTSGKGKDQGSKKGIERKYKENSPKEKIMILADDTGDDENLTGAVSEDGNSYMEFSDSQLSFGTKKNLEDVAGDYAMSAFTAIDNNTVPSNMTEVVRTYFDIF